MTPTSVPYARHADVIGRSARLPADVPVGVTLMSRRAPYPLPDACTSRVLALLVQRCQARRQDLLWCCHGCSFHAGACAARLCQCDCKRCAQSDEHISDVALVCSIHAEVRASTRTCAPLSRHKSEGTPGSIYTRRSDVNAASRAPCFVQVLATTDCGSHRKLA